MRLEDEIKHCQLVSLCTFVALFGKEAILLYFYGCHRLTAQLFSPASFLLSICSGVQLNQLAALRCSCAATQLNVINCNAY